MFSEYDKSLHSPHWLKAMESPGRELDDVATDAAIAGLLKDEAPTVAKADQAAPQARLEFPSLTSAEESEADAEPKETGVTAILRQTWAHLSGAA